MSIEIIYDIGIVITGIAAYNLIHTISDVIFKIYQRVKEAKHGVPKMDNKPLPPKSFKERLEEKTLNSQ